MGKVKTVTMGDEKVEEQTRQKAKAKRESKKVIKKEEKVEAEVQVEEPKKAKAKKSSDKYSFEPGKKYVKVASLVDKKKNYPLSEALDLVKKTSYSKFDGTVEIHCNVKEKGLRGLVSLPHGTGKEVRVKVADDALIESLSKGAPIDFDILVAQPSMMAKLAKVAKILGPKGLMPNPKTGTIGEDTEKLVKNLSKGQIQFKTEADFPIIHSVIGKVSFEKDKLTDNYNALVKAIGKDKINSVFVKPTMGPSIKITI